MNDVCDSCGKGPADGVEVHEGIDPYQWDIYDEEVECKLCDDCYQNRVDDI